MNSCVIIVIEGSGNVVVPEAVAMQLLGARAALGAAARWGRAAENAGAAGEAPRLLAWAVKTLRGRPHWRHVVEVSSRHSRDDRCSNVTQFKYIHK